MTQLEQQLAKAKAELVKEELSTLEKLQTINENQKELGQEELQSVLFFQVGYKDLAGIAK